MFLVWNHALRIGLPYALFDVWLICLIVGLALGTYGIERGVELKLVYFFLFQKSIVVEEINWIGFRPTWKIQGGLARSLYVVQENSTQGRKVLEFKNSIFSQETLGKMLSDLKKKNPHLALDEEAQNQLGWYQRKQEGRLSEEEKAPFKFSPRLVRGFIGALFSVVIFISLSSLNLNDSPFVVLYPILIISALGFLVYGLSEGNNQ